MSNELVKDLEWAREIVSVHGSQRLPGIMDRAIAFIQATPSRDEVLDGVAQAMRDKLVATQTRSAAINFVIGLKSAPNTKESPKMYERRMGDGVQFTQMSPDTRVLADRRKSAHGDRNEHAMTDSERWRRNNPSTEYGRRSDDRARWTGEAAPVVEPVSEFCGRAPYHHCWQTTPHGHDICVECKLTRTTQPAQEASQSLPRPRRMAFVNSLVHTINSNSMENGSNTPDYILTSFLEQVLEAFDYAVNAREKHYGRPLDRRQGAK